MKDCEVTDWSVQVMESFADWDGVPENMQGQQWFIPTTAAGFPLIDQSTLQDKCASNVKVPGLTPMRYYPSPATHAILTVLKAGEHVIHTFLLTKTVVHVYRGAQPLSHALFWCQNTV